MFILRTDNGNFNDDNNDLYIAGKKHEKIAHKIFPKQLWTVLLLLH